MLKKEIHVGSRQVSFIKTFWGQKYKKRSVGLGGFWGFGFGWVFFWIPCREGKGEDLYFMKHYSDFSNDTLFGTEMPTSIKGKKAGDIQNLQTLLAALQVFSVTSFTYKGNTAQKTKPQTPCSKMFMIWEAEHENKQSSERKTQKQWLETIGTISERQKSIWIDSVEQITFSLPPQSLSPSTYQPPRRAGRQRGILVTKTDAKMRLAKDRNKCQKQSSCND